MSPPVTAAILGACPICGSPRPRNRPGDDIWCCCISCYRAWHLTATADDKEALTT